MDKDNTQFRKIGKLYITLHVFSGRENPEWTINHDHQLYNDILLALADVKPSRLPQRLGYRGFEVQYEPAGGEKSPSLIITSFLELESKLLTSAPGHLVHHVVAQHVLETVVNRHNERVMGQDSAVNSTSYQKQMVENGLGYGQLPEYKPDEWNSDTHREKLLKNNSYNYANNIVTNTLAQPGRFNHRERPNPQTGIGWMLNAQVDGLVPISCDSKNPNSLPECSDNIVCLVFWPIGPKDEYDFHWYRMDDGGFWSHKLGTHQVTDKDNLDQPIRNPRVCDRGVYTQFIGYMSTALNRVHIK